MSHPMRDFALEVYFSKWEFVARFNLAGSDAESMTVSALLELATPDERAAFADLHLGYTETLGAPALRAAIADTYDSCAPEHILCFAGAEEAIYIAMRVLLGAGDHAIVVTPNYQAAETVPLSVCEVTGVPLRADGHWTLDLDDVRDAFRPNTRVVSINFPNNPTGRIVPREQLDAIIAMCRERGVWLFSDEVYRLIERDTAQRLPQAVDLYERAMSLNVMSKAYGLAGLRIGWIACKDADMLRRLERYKHYLSICNSGPSEMLARIALRVRDTLLARNRRIVADNLALLDTFFADYPQRFDWRRPDGGCVGFVRYKGGDGVDAFTRRLVEDTSVLLLPASVFRSELNDVPPDFFRIGYGRALLPEGLGIVRDWMERKGG
jgi:aspartate/methionine/tyrosine aminotransferase